MTAIQNAFHRLLRNRWLVVCVCSFAVRVAAQANLEEARYLFEAGRLDEARQVLTALITQDPTHAEAAFWLGRLAYQEQQYDRAVEWFRRAVQRDDTQSAYHLWLGRAYGYQAQQASLLRQPFLAKKVQAHFEKAVALNPDNVAARWDLMEYYLKAPGFLGGSHEKARVQAAEISKRDAQEGCKAWRIVAERGGTFSPEQNTFIGY